MPKKVFQYQMRSIIFLNKILFLEYLDTAMVDFVERTNGWYGVDCSSPTVSSAITDWPDWLRPCQVHIPEDATKNGSVVNLTAIVKKKRPLVYVYDLPPEFNSLLLEGRHYKM